MTHTERFFGINGFAASTIGAPQMIYSIDRKVFEKNRAEKSIAKDIKQDHKNELRKVYGEGYKKQLNIPSRTIVGRIVNQF